jgi:hypothetical protein
VQNENRSGVRRFRAICSKFLNFTMCLYGLLSRTVNVSDCVTSKGRIITEQGTRKNLEESGRFHREVTHGDFGATEKTLKNFS